MRPSRKFRWLSSALRSEREGTVTLCFTDIVKSSALAQTLGNRRWARLLQWHDETIGSIVESRGGEVVKTLGDGTMIAYEATQPAAYAAIQIQRAMAARREAPQLRLRIGIHIGDVIKTGDDYIGHAVNKAARIASVARGGEIMASGAFVVMLSDSSEFEFGDISEIELRGLDGLHRVAPLLHDSETGHLSVVGGGVGS